MTTIFACYIVGLIGALLVAGVLSDRVGRRPVLLPALGLALVACLLFGVADSVAVLALARLLTGIAVGATVSAGMAAVTDAAAEGQQRLAALAASAAMVLGAGSGPLLAGLTSQYLPGPTVMVFGIEAVLLLTALPVVLGFSARGSGTGGWMRVPSVPRGQGFRLLCGIAVFAPGITATSFVLSLGPSLLTQLLGTTNRVVAGATAFVMFAAATGIQFALQRRTVRSLLLTGAAATTAGMAALILAVHLNLVVALVAAAVLAGTGQGLGQLGGLSLLNAHVPQGRRAEANAALNIGGYVPAGALSVATGYLSDAIGLPAAGTAFGITLALLAVAGGMVVVSRS
jgi:MFS family permease